MVKITVEDQIAQVEGSRYVEGDFSAGICTTVSDIDKTTMDVSNTIFIVGEINSTILLEALAELVATAVIKAPSKSIIDKMMLADNFLDYFAEKMTQALGGDVLEKEMQKFNNIR